MKNKTAFITVVVGLLLSGGMFAAGWWAGYEYLLRQVYEVPDGRFTRHSIRLIEGMDSVQKKRDLDEITIHMSKSGWYSIKCFTGGVQVDHYSPLRLPMPYFPERKDQ